VAIITLTKHHGLGNDFLIVIDPPVSLGPEWAIRWCDRRRGIGADGLIAAEVSADDPSRCTMTLWNADGSRAELSGNGLRCLGQALVRGGGASKGGRPPASAEVVTFEALTDAGPRRLTVEPRPTSDTDLVTVDMGKATPGPAPWSDWAEVGLRVEAELGVDVGNPHLVALVDDPEAVDLGSIGPLVEASYPGGLNLELITVDSPSSLTLRVWERGAGLTEACGSGACASAWAAHQWGRVGPKVEVTMPGGTATVEIGDDNLRLRGPATYVARIEVEHR
jgi:diaminopimelate epimerase